MRWKVRRQRRCLCACACAGITFVAACLSLRAACLRVRSTQSEVVVPLVVPRTNEVLGVLDIDSDDPAAFDGVDAAQLESLCRWLATKYGGAVTHSAGGGVAEAAVVEG